MSHPCVHLHTRYKLVQALEDALSLGSPSLARCSNLKVEGYVYFSKRNVFVGKVTLMNASKEPKVLPPGTYENCTVDLSAAPGLGALCPSKAKTAPIADQKPGTSGLRKKTRTFMEGSYLQNFVQATFNAIKTSGADLKDKTLLVGGDGRYFNPEAIQIILKMAVANGVNHIAIGQVRMNEFNGITPECARVDRLHAKFVVYWCSCGCLSFSYSHLSVPFALPRVLLLCAITGRPPVDACGLSSDPRAWPLVHEGLWRVYSDGQPQPRWARRRLWHQVS